MISCSVVPPVGGWYSVFMVGADWQMESYLSNLTRYSVVSSSNFF